MYMKITKFSSPADGTGVGYNGKQIRHDVEIFRLN